METLNSMLKFQAVSEKSAKISGATFYAALRAIVRVHLTSI